MDNNVPNNAERSLAICPLFESELLLWLMLRSWNHPLAEDAHHRNQLLERATEVLGAAARGPSDQVFVEGLPARDMNFVAAIWYVESLAIEDLRRPNDEHGRARRQWLEDVHRALPSCFCPSDDLPP